MSQTRRWCTNSISIVIALTQRQKLKHREVKLMTLDTQLASHTSATQDHFCLNPKLVLFLLPPAASERGQDKLGSGMPLRCSWRGAGNSQKERSDWEEDTEEARNERVKRGKGWPTVSKPTGRSQMGRIQQLVVGSPRSPELVLPPHPRDYAFLLSATPAALAFLCPSGKYAFY